MKALTIREPFASLVTYNLKCYETRSWPTKYRGPILIHAGLAKVNLKDERLKKLTNSLPKSNNPGHILCQATLKDCILMTSDFIDKVKQNEKEYLAGHYEVGRYAWLLTDIKLIEPISYKGALGLWNFPGPINML